MKTIEADWSLDELLQAVEEAPEEEEDPRYKTPEQWARIFGIGVKRMRSYLRRLKKAGKVEQKRFRSLDLVGRPFYQSRFRLLINE